MEKAAIVAASQAIEEANIAADRDNVIFILSTTKGNPRPGREPLRGMQNARVQRTFRSGRGRADRRRGGRLGAHYAGGSMSGSPRLRSSAL